MSILFRLFAMAILVSAGAFAQEPVVVLTDLTQDQLAGGLANLGYKPQPAGNGIQFAVGESTVTAAKTGTALVLSVPLKARMSLAEANDWNRENSFAKVIIVGAGARLQSELSLKGGVTAAALDAFVGDFARMLGSLTGTASSGGPVKPMAAPVTPAPPAQAPTGPALSVHARSANAKTEVRTPFGDFSIWVDSTKWRQTPLPDEPAIVQFESLAGDAYAKVISEKTGIPRLSLRDIAVENARKLDPSIKVTLKEERMVNGRRIAVMQMDGVVKSLPIIYYGYYYGGTTGSVQVVCFTLKSSFEQNLERFTELLDGLEARDQALPDAEPRSTMSELKLGNKLVFSYDSAKWKQTKEEEPGRYSFTLGSGTGYALVIYEGLSVPLDNLPDVALNNAKAADPNAKVASREKITVNEMTVWRQKMTANVKGIPVTYFGHYFGGDGGTVQVLTYCGQSQFAELEGEMTEFLGGLRAAK